MSKFFDLIPLTLYDIDNTSPSNYQSVRNIFFRLKVVREVIGNISAYHEYTIKDDDRPETIAEKVYGDAEAHWIILLANEILDPQYDWPLTTQNFNKYIISKYGSIANAKTTIHHYEEVITRNHNHAETWFEYRYRVDQQPYTSPAFHANNTSNVQIYLANTTATSFAVGNTVNTVNNLFTGTVTSYSYNDEYGYITIAPATGYFTYGQKIQKTDNLASNGTIVVVNSPQASLVQDPTIPYNTYQDLADTQYYQAIDMGDGTTVLQIIKRDAITNYDYEEKLNEKRRTIKIIKPEYYPQIMAEFNSLTGYANAPFRRRIV